MTQHNNSAYKPLNRFWLRLLTQSMSFIGIFSLLSSNLVLAQTEAAIDNFASPPNQNSQSSIAVNATPAPHSSQARWQRLRQQLRSAPQQRYSNATPASQKIPSPQIGYTPQTIRPILKRQNHSTTLNNPTVGRLKSPNANSAKDNSGAYIDPTDYKIGATTGYEAPKSVVLSERLSGCIKTVLRAKISGSICNPNTWRQARIARLTGQSVRSTRRTSFVATAAVRPIQVGPIAFDAKGFRVTTNPETRHSIISYKYRDLQSNWSGIDPKFMFPLTIPTQITSLFGWRTHPLTGNLRFHTGTDLGAPLGTPVLASYPGNVEVADYMGGYGLTVVLNHNKSTLQTLYGHLSEIFVQPGEQVEQGTVIGRVGSTGNSTGPHLHFETRQMTPDGWVAVDPGAQLEYAFAQLVKALQTAQSHQKPDNRV